MSIVKISTPKPTVSAIPSIDKSMSFTGASGRYFLRAHNTVRLRTSIIAISSNNAVIHSLKKPTMENAPIVKKDPVRKNIKALFE